METPSPSAPAFSLANCIPLTYHTAGAMQVIDSLLTTAGQVRGEDVDTLLDLRWAIHHRENAEVVLNLFCKLRRAMEDKHYLAFYRLRRWLENHVQAKVCLRRGETERTVSPEMNFFCLEAIRGQCVRSAMKQGDLLLAPRAHFFFRPVVEKVLVTKA